MDRTDAMDGGDADVNLATEYTRLAQSPGISRGVHQRGTA